MDNCPENLATWIESEAARMEEPIVVSSGETTRTPSSPDSKCNLIDAGSVVDIGPPPDVSLTCPPSSPVPDPDGVGRVGEDSPESSRMASPSLESEVVTNVPRLRMDGIAWIVLKSLADLGRLEMTRSEYRELLSKSPVMRQNSEMVLITIATVQSLASYPQIREAVENWASVISGILVRDLSCMGFGHSLEPWNCRNLWAFDLWAAVNRILPKFLVLDITTDAQDFINRMQEDPLLSDRSPSEIEMVVSALFTIRDSPWFWPFLG